MQEPHRNRVTLVLGGVRSGKSRFALELAVGCTKRDIHRYCSLFR